MRRVLARSRWPRITRIIGLGLALGLVQLLLLWVASLLQQIALSWGLYAGADALFSLSLPAIAAFFASQRTGKDASGVGAGCLVWGISALVVLIVAGIGVSMILNAPQPSCPPDCSRFPATGFALAGLQGIVVLVLLGGGFMALLGGIIGGNLGQRHALAAYQRGRREESDGLV